MSDNMVMVQSFVHRRKNRRVSLGLADRPRRRKIIDGKDYFVLKLDVAHGGGDFAEARRNHIHTKRSISVASMGMIVSMFFKHMYGFDMSQVELIILDDGTGHRFKEREGA